MVHSKNDYDLYYCENKTYAKYRKENDMSIKDDLEKRMKTFYEQVPKTKLMRRCPVAVRIDRKSFRTFTKNLQKPFDEVLIKTMQDTMKYLCENIQGCVLGYTQSDEITLILVDYKKLTSSAWFNYEVQKICSIAASMATMAFNKYFIENYLDYYLDYLVNYGDRYHPNFEDKKDVEKWRRICGAYSKAAEKVAMFDARCFNIPKEEVANLLYWRQWCASRNSVQMVGQANFSHKKLQNKTCSDIQDVLMTQKGINWNELPTHQKRGSCCIKTLESISDSEENKNGTKRSHWIIDTEIPIFRGEGREYIDKLVYVGEE